jgi:hypothetical protein
MTSSALLASSAPPSPFGTASGSSSSLPGPENVNPPSSSLGVECLLSALSAEPPPTPFSDPTPQAESCRSRAVGRLSWGSCSHERNYVGCPLLSPNRPESRLVRARVAKPPPVPSSGFLPLTTVQALYARGAFETLADPAVCRGPRRFAALFHAARVPGTALQSFPFPRSRARSREPLLPCVFRYRSPPAQSRQEFTIAFTAAPKLFARATLPEEDRGRMSLGQGFPAFARSAAVTCP